MRVPLIVVALLLSGCLSGNEPVETASVEETAATQTSADATNVTQEPPALAPQTFPISFDGKTGNWACVPSGPTSCNGLPVGTNSENTFVEVAYDGVATSAEITLTWTPTTPATNEMSLALFAMRSCGEGCIEMDSEMYYEEVSGMSPLSLSANGITLGENETLYVHVGTVDPTPSLPAPFFYSLEQAFTVEGTLTALVPQMR